MAQSITPSDPIVTNRINPHFRLDAFLRDFDVYLIEWAAENDPPNEEALHKRMPITDYPVFGCRALSVAYTNKKECLALFRKDEVQEGEFHDKMEAYDDNYEVKRITLYDIQNASFQKRHLFFEYRMLIQLLFNAVPSLLDDTGEVHYSNISGELLYPFPGKSDKKVSFLRIKLRPNMMLELSVQTYRRFDPNKTVKGKGGKKRKRIPCKPVIIDGYGRLHPYTSGTKSTRIFEKRSSIHHHNVKDFVSWGRYENFRKSKCGILAKFLRDVKTCLSDYVTLSFEELQDCSQYNFEPIRAKVEEYDGSKKDQREFFYNAFERPIALSFNLPDFEEWRGAEYLDCIRQELEDTYGIHALIVDRPVKDYYNIHLIHDRKWYRRQKSADPYRNAHLPVKRMQCITMEAISVAINGESDEEEGETKATLAQIVKKSLSELIVKRDLLQNRCSFVRPWESEYLPSQTWTFVSFQRTKLKKEKGYFYYFFGLTVYPDGSLSSFEFDEEAFLPKKIYMDIVNAVKGFYADADSFSSNGLRMSGEELEGLYYNDKDRALHQIIHTTGFLMPNVEEIEHMLHRSSPDLLIRQTDFEQWSEEFKQSYPKAIPPNDPEFRKLATTPQKPEFKLSEYLECLLPVIGYKDSGAAIRERFPTSKLAKSFFRFLYEHHDILVKPLKQDWQLRCQRLTGYLKCHYFRSTRKVLKNHCVQYTIPVVGYMCGKRDAFKALKQSKAIHIRHILINRRNAKPEDIQYSEILPMMGYAFVRSDYTVLPWPFKYLREIMRVFEIEKGIKYADTEEELAEIDEELENEGGGDDEK